VGVFSVAASFAAFGAGLAILFSQGLLYAYAFTAINRVSGGEIGSFLPSIGDLADLVEPLRVGVAALIVSSGPLVALAFLVPPQDVLESLGAPGPAAAIVAPAPEEETPSPEPTLAPEVEALLDEEESPDSTAEGDAAADPEAAADEEYDSGPLVPPWALPAFVLAIAWKLVYSPIALVAGAISRSFLSTLNPIAGLDAIRRMGSTYWTAMAVYTVIAVVEALLGAALSMVPFAGGFLRAFVQSYAFLAIGCLLGLAVFKKGPELGLD
jgi:hypothetical protein